jgi:hypothetical protein
MKPASVWREIRRRMRDSDGTLSSAGIFLVTSALSFSFALVMYLIYLFFLK